MKLAITSQEEIDALSQVLREVEWLHKELKGSFLSEVDFEGFQILNGFDKTDPEEFLTSLCCHISGIHFQRILMNCSTMLDNCADPELKYLDFNKDIKAGLELLELQKQSGEVFFVPSKAA